MLQFKFSLAHSFSENLKINVRFMLSTRRGSSDWESTRLSGSLHLRVKLKTGLSPVQVRPAAPQINPRQTNPGRSYKRSKFKVDLAIWICFMKESRKILVSFVVLFLCIFIPPITTVPLTAQETMLVIRDVFIQTSVAYLWLSPVIHVTTIMLLIALYRYGPKMGRVVDAFFGILFLFIAFSNHIAMTENYGLVVLTGNLVPILIVGLFWMWEAFRPRNEYVF